MILHVHRQSLNRGSGIGDFQEFLTQAGAVDFHKTGLVSRDSTIEQLNAEEVSIRRVRDRLVFVFFVNAGGTLFAR
jgi:hypothetical protein